jgi:AraC family transcriptional regulator of adaptative response / DNA-3-methyladenine glycosylase II
MAGRDHARAAARGASLAPALPLLIRRVRQWLDLDADPAAIEQVLAPHFGPLAGLRVPGTLDGFELAVRAILGQQVSVAAGRTLCQRLVERLGAACPARPTPRPGSTACSPTRRRWPPWIRRTAC